jgi:cell wall-associated NlpC family hydrolase
MRESSGDGARVVSRARRTGSRAAAIAVTLAVAGAAVLYAQGAGAASPPSISQVQAQVNKLQAQVDQVGQQYDAVTQQVASAKARLASVERLAAAAQARYAASQAKLSEVAVASYENANQTSVMSLLTSGDPAQVLRQASLFEQMGDNHSEQVLQFLAVAQQVTTTKDNVLRTEEGVNQLQVQLAAKKASLTTLLDKSTALLGNLNLAQQQAVAAAAVGGSGSFITSATDPFPQNTPGQKAVYFAYSKLGTWYLWGGTGPQYDCSGLVQAAWAYAGVSIPRTTYSQWAALPHVSKSALQAGDLVFFNGEGHVGIYVGGGLMIDAPRTGEQIRLLPLDTDWYLQNYDGAARPA